MIRPTATVTVALNFAYLRGGDEGINREDINRYILPSEILR